MAQPVVTGVSAEEQLPDAHEVLQRAISRFNKYQDSVNKKRNQSIKFDSFPFGLAFIADNHIGAQGTDYARMFAEAELIASTPNLYVVQVGDLVDNYIIGKLLALRMGTSMPIDEEWVLAKHYMELLGSRLVGVCGGNHDAWTERAAGIDNLRNLVMSLKNPKVLYDANELYFNVDCGATHCPVRIRHRWRYSSIHNPTHGIERTFERDSARPFLLGVGAHTHVSGLVRQFNAGGVTGLAVQCGTYKIHDSYANQLGAPAPNGSTAIVVVFTEHGMQGHDSLPMAIERLNG